MFYPNPVRTNISASCFFGEIFSAASATVRRDPTNSKRKALTTILIGVTEVQYDSSTFEISVGILVES